MKVLLSGIIVAVAFANSVLLASEVHDAVLAGDASRLAKALDASPSSIDAEDAQGYTPLFLAALRGDKSIVEFLLRRHASVTYRKEEPSVEDDDGMGGMRLDTVIAVGGKSDVHKEDFAALHCAVAGGNSDVVDLLLENGAKLEERDFQGRTPLFWASDGQMAEHLLSKGCHVNAANDFNATPMHAAVEAGKFDVVKALLKNKANINAQNIGGWMPLHVAVMNFRPEIAELLLESGANADFPGREGQTPIHIAALKHDSAMIALLLKRKADPKIKDDLGRTVADIQKKSDAALAELVESIRKTLPTNWTATVTSKPDEVRCIQIKRTDTVLVKEHNPFPNPAPEDGSKRPEPYEFTFTFGVEPYLSKEQYRARKCELAQRQQRIDAIREKLRDIPERMPSGREDGWYRPRNADDRSRIAELTKFLDEHPSHRLPTHQWRDFSFYAFYFFSDGIEFMVDAEQAECNSVRKKVERILVPYDMKLIRP